MTLVMMTKNEDNTSDKIVLKATNEILNDDWIGINHLYYLSTPFTAKDVCTILDEVTNKPIKVTYKTSTKQNKNGEKDNYITKIQYV